MTAQMLTSLRPCRGTEQLYLCHRCPLLAASSACNLYHPVHVPRSGSIHGGHAVHNLVSLHSDVRHTAADHDFNQISLQ